MIHFRSGHLCEIRLWYLRKMLSISNGSRPKHHWHTAVADHFQLFNVLQRQQLDLDSRLLRLLQRSASLYRPRSQNASDHTANDQQNNEADSEKEETVIVTGGCLI